MHIGIVGAGKIGVTVARLLLAAGHTVTVSNSRNPRSLEPLVKELGEGARAGTPEQAVADAELVVASIPFKAVPSLAALPLAGKIVIDTSNYYPERDGPIDFKGRSSSELFAAHARGRVVKAFNTLNFNPLGSEGKPDAPLEQRIALFVAGDDAPAKKTVLELIESLGFAPLDTGSLAHSKVQEPGSKIYNKPLRLPEAREALARLG